MTLERDIKLTTLLRTEREIKFHENHILIYGIYDDNGVELLIDSDDWNTIVGLERLSSRSNSYKLRCLYNTHRNATYYIRWIFRKKLENLKELLNNQKFNECKSLIINESIPI